MKVSVTVRYEGTEGTVTHTEEREVPGWGILGGEVTGLLVSACGMLAYIQAAAKASEGLVEWMRGKGIREE